MGRRCGPRGRSGGGRSCSGAVGGDELSPQRRAFQLDPVRAVNDAVEDRVTERGISNHLVPFANRDLAGDQQRVAVIDDIEEVASLFGIERLRPPVVDDQEPDAFEHRQEARQAALAARLGQVAKQPIGALIEHGEAFAAGFVAESAGQPRLTDTGRPDADQMMMLAQPFAGGELFETERGRGRGARAGLTSSTTAAWRRAAGG